MSLEKFDHTIAKTKSGKNRKSRSQQGAICYRLEKGDVQILLITSRRSKRWIIPKGWPIDGTPPEQAAAIEAYEEAGVQGRVQEGCVGFYSYIKTTKKLVRLPCLVAVFAIEVDALLQDFPERDQRNRKWFSQIEASELVAEPELKQIIRRFAP